MPVNDDEMGPMSFQKELDRRGGGDVSAMDDDENGDGETGGGDGENGGSEEDDEFDGDDLRDVICEKWGECFDVEFQKVDSYGFRSVYLVRSGRGGTIHHLRRGDEIMCIRENHANRERTKWFVAAVLSPFRFFVYIYSICDVSRTSCPSVSGVRGFGTRLSTITFAICRPW